MPLEKFDAKFEVSLEKLRGMLLWESTVTPIEHFTYFGKIPPNVHKKELQIGGV
jgi:hypothetical protein